MNFITLTPENLEAEHICCAISNNRDCQVAAKKEWLRDRFADGLVFRRADARGKCFIEYLPAEKAWAPVLAPGWLYIDCLWVSGALKGQGYAKALLESAIADARKQGKAGLVTLSSVKKQPFLSDPSFLAHEGFVPVAEAAPAYRLYALALRPDASTPAFAPGVGVPPKEKGYVLYYSHQCPFTAKYVPLLRSVAEEAGVPFCAVRFTSCAEAQDAPSPFTAFSLFLDGRLLTHEILSEKKFRALLGM